MLKQIEIAYPQTVKIIGREKISQLAKEWNQKGFFHDHLKNQKSYPYLPDLAKLEYLLYQSFISEDKPFCLDMDQLLIDLEKNPQKVVLEVSQPLFLLKSHFPIQEIWQAIKLEQNLDQIELTTGDYHYIINTLTQTTGAYLVSPIIYQTVERLKEKATSLDDIVTELFKQAGPQELQQVLQHILSSGWIQNYHLLPY